MTAGIIPQRLWTRCFHIGAPYRSMKAWQAYQYGTPDVLELSSITRPPTLESPTDILIKVEATSVNPLDTKMLNGYGTTTMKTLKCVNKFPKKPVDFPLILGRDFVGEVVDYGRNVTGFKVGDRVWGAIPPFRTGCHAEYVSTCSSNISKAPVSLTAAEASSLPYVALTFNSAWRTAGTFVKPPNYLRGLVLGGTGGVGSFAIQYLKHLGLEITTTCSGDAQQQMIELGADFVVDYKAGDYMQRLNDLKEYDFILDCAGMGADPLYLDLMKPNGFSKFLTLTTPLLGDIDKFGLVFGGLLAASKAAQNTFMGLRQGKSIRWAYFAPDGKFLKKLAGLVDEGKIKPVVDRIFQFEDTKEAYQHVISGHARGKTVIVLSNKTEV